MKGWTLRRKQPKSRPGLVSSTEALPTAWNGEQSSGSSWSASGGEEEGTSVASPPASSSREQLEMRLKQMDQVVATANVLSQELKAKVSLAQEQIKELQEDKAKLQSCVDLLLGVIGDINARSRGAPVALTEGEARALLEAERKAGLMAREMNSVDDARVEMTPSNRQDRLDRMANTIHEHVYFVEQFLAQKRAEAPKAAPGADFFSLNASPLLLHLVLSWLQPSDLLALACTSKQFLERCKAFRLHQRRTAAVLEFCHSERLHMSQVHVLVDEFGKALERNSICDMHLLVCNAQALRGTSRALIHSLTARLERWSATQTVGDVFNEMVSAFGFVSFYAENLDSALRTLRWLNSRPETRAVVDDVARRTGADLASLLLLPVKHTEAYLHFLNAQLACTPAFHTDLPFLSRASEQLRVILSEMGSASRLAPGETMLDYVEGMPPELKRHQPAVLRDGLATLVRGGSGAVRLFLCADCMVLATVDGATTPERATFLRQFAFTPPPYVMASETNGTVLDVHCLDAASDVALAFATDHQKITWLQAIKTNIDCYMERHVSERKAYNELRNRFVKVAVPISPVSLADTQKPASPRAASSTLRGMSKLRASAGTLRSVVDKSPPPDTSAPLLASKRSMTLSRKEAKSAKNLRGLQKRYSLTELPDDTLLYQVFKGNVVAHLDVHPASLSCDGVFVLRLAGDVYLYKGSKLGASAEELHTATFFAGRLLTDKTRSVLLVDAQQPGVDDKFWSAFGGKVKVTETTPKDVLARYSGTRPALWVIHPDKLMTQAPFVELSELLKSPNLLLVVDALDDVYLFVGEGAPASNVALATAKAEEVLEEDILLRPACASVHVVCKGSKDRVVTRGTKDVNPVFELLAALAVPPALAEQSSPTSSPPNLKRAASKWGKKKGPSSPRSADNETRESPPAPRSPLPQNAAQQQQQQHQQQQQQQQDEPSPSMAALGFLESALAAEHANDAFELGDLANQLLQELREERQTETVAKAEEPPSQPQVQQVGQQPSRETLQNVRRSIAQVLAEEAKEKVVASRESGRNQVGSASPPKEDDDQDDHDEDKVLPVAAEDPEPLRILEASDADDVVILPPPSPRNSDRVGHGEYDTVDTEAENIMHAIFDAQSPRQNEELNAAEQLRLMEENRLRSLEEKQRRLEELRRKKAAEASASGGGTG